MLLFTPGPTPIPESIRQAMAIPTLHHRTKEFESYFEFCRIKLIELMNMQDVLMLASSGSGAMEASIRTFCKKPLCINSGKFGERFVKIAKVYNMPFVEILNDWDTAPNSDEIANILKQDNEIDSICIQMCESAGGLRHNVESIAKVAKEINKDIVIIVDAITALGVEEIDTTNIDVLIGGSQKAFMLPPGMAIIGLSGLALDLIDKNDIGFYFNLKTELKNQRKNTTAWTSPTTIIIGLAKYFEIANIKDIYKETKQRAIATRESLKSLNLKIYPKNPALAMTTIYNEDSLKIRKILKEKYYVNIAGGQDKLKDSIFRINHMGIIPINEALWVVNAIELTLNDLNIRKFDGNASKVFLENYFKQG
ncbi:alanine--glyoxylate aminotransferase family protein [Helicobacter sp. MIT 99-5507]|uniref:pyridoxal-phosphate-dependent aminotransferase family protein n=1 Tax=Helicobacter sp. MIT 99-5507 TaxID=152489 RepID=UPI000E1ECB66|nr:alanine--glyoxylate aminotransferase family protein [Helicobacter sp. MIT 99-5507]RDU58117.1 aminotransferase [Helicobacter sp. MIT 99-5507]